MTEPQGREFEEIKIPVPWGHISAKWWGPRDKNPVIAIHGWQDNAGSFDNLMPLLPADLAVLCIDLPGHGFSSQLPAGQFYYIWWDSVVNLRRVVLHLGLERVSLLGHSLGGGVGFLYAATYPDEVDKLVSIDIVCPRVIAPDHLSDQTSMCINRFLKYEAMANQQPPMYEREEALNVVRDAHLGGLSMENCEVLMRRGMKPSPSNDNTYYFSRDPRVKVSGLSMLSKDHAVSFAQKIKCEYLNIRAENGIGFVYPELYNELLEIIKKKSPRFEFHKVPGTHHVHLENAASVATIIGDFLSAEENPMSIANNYCDIII